jgi:DNA-binding MarR family transcriptional regulator
MRESLQCDLSAIDGYDTLMVQAPEIDEAFRLREALREFTARSAAITRLHGLTPEQYQLLLILRVWPKEQATIGNLYTALHRGQSAVTQLARRMENRGLIRRELSSSDARVRYLKLTKRGEERLAAAVDALQGERDRLLDLVAGLGAGTN